MASLEEAVTRSLQCPICLQLLTEPKLLTCAHTFCTPCVTLLYNSRNDEDALSCPVCRKITVVKHGDVTQLLTNLQAKALVSDVAGARQLCTNCDASDVEAVTFCQDCKLYMCTKCQKKHVEWKANITHQLSTVDDIKLGKVVLKKKTLCQEHDPGEGEHDCTDVCLTCSKIICMRCRVLDHEKKGHNVQSAVKYTTGIKDQIQNLRDRAGNKAEGFKKHSAFIDEQKKRVSDHNEKQKLEIDMIYQECVRRLSERKDILMNQCYTEKNKIIADLDRMKADSEINVASIESARELAGNSLKAPLEGDIVAIRQSFCDKINDVIGRDDACYRDSAVVAGRAEKFIFQQTTVENELELGRVKYIEEIKLKTETPLSVESIMNTLAATREGRMAVGYNPAGIEIYNPDGQLQEVVLKGVAIYSLGFLLDGRCVVIHGNNTMSLYTAEWEKIDATFETLNYAAGGYPVVTANSDNLLYVSYRKAKKIHVFTPAGGKPIREIPCDTFSLQQIFTLKSKNDLIVKNANSVRVIAGDTGAVKHRVSKQGVYPYPAVSHDDSVIIAWVKHDEGLVTIDQYTSELNHVTTLISDHNIDNPKKRNWYYLNEFFSGEIALCTPDKLYIFH